MPGLVERKLDFDIKHERKCELKKVLKCVDGMRERIRKKVTCARIVVSAVTLNNQHRLEL